MHTPPTWHLMPLLQQVTAPLLVALLAAGCASTLQRDTVIRIQAPQVTDTGRIQISDARQQSSKEARPDLEIRQFVYLGDSALDPPPVLLLTRFLAKGMDGSTASLAIELIRFDVGLSTSEVRDIYNTSPPIFIIGDAPAGATAIGNIVGQLLVAAFKGGSTNQSVVVNLEVRVAAEHITVSDFGLLYSGRSISDAVETVVPRALATLSAKVADRLYRPAASKISN
jgi:hypothetical protein